VFYHVIRRLFLLLAGPMFAFRVEGRERLPARGPLVVIAPHRSWLDPPVVGAACPRVVRFLIVDHIYRRRGQHWFYRRMRSLPVRAGGAASLPSLREALRHLRDGGVVGVFPEGRVVRETAAGEVQAGAALLALRSGALIVPIAIEGTAAAWPHGQRLPRPRRVAATIGAPIRPPGRDEPRAFERTVELIRDALSAVTAAGPDAAADARAGGR
jgi:1-acyl-sn-glycerol-3-phosphate acyltransferase